MLTVTTQDRIKELVINPIVGCTIRKVIYVYKWYHINYTVITNDIIRNFIKVDFYKDGNQTNTDT